MGADMLDCAFRIEKEFGFRRNELKLEVIDQLRGEGGTITNFTAMQIARCVGMCLQLKGVEPPTDLWPRVRACIAATICAPIETVMPTSRLIEDLGFS